MFSVVSVYHSVCRMGERSSCHPHSTCSNLFTPNTGTGPFLPFSHHTGTPSHFKQEYKARHAHKRLYTVLPKYSKIQVLPGITSCRLVKDNKQAIELNSSLLNNMPKEGYG